MEMEDDRPKNADRVGTIDGHEIFGFNKIDTKWFDDKSRIHYICSMQPQRPGVNLFAAILEYKFYPPDTVKNKKFIFQIIKWNPEPDLRMMFGIISIPVKEKSYAEATAKIIGMRIADGIPTLIGKNVKPFPIACKNAFTIENDTDHPVYKSIMHQKEFIKLEHRLCNLIFNGHGDQVEKEFEKVTKGK